MQTMDSHANSVNKRGPSSFLGSTRVPKTSYARVAIVRPSLVMSQKRESSLSMQTLLAASQRGDVSASAAAPALYQAPPVTTIPLKDKTYAKEIEAAIKAVQLASTLCQTVQNQLKSDEKIEKDDDSPVTVADYGAQALVAWSLQHTLPDQKLSLVAEEDAEDLRAPEAQAVLRRVTDLVNQTLADIDAPPLTPTEVVDLLEAGYSDGGPTGRHWVLDPIDGTRGFVGMRQYAVCLGLLVDGEVVLGVLGCPNLPVWPITDRDCDSGQACRAFTENGIGSIFAAVQGEGAYFGGLWEGPNERVYCNDSVPVDEVRYMQSFDKRHSNHTISAAVAEEIGIELPSLKLDSQAKYGALARGDASIFMRFPPSTYQEKIWDHAAGAIIIEEAGAKITDYLGNKLDFSKGRYFPFLNGGLIAATPSMHKAIMAALRTIDESSQ